MFKFIFSSIRKWAALAERDRSDDKFSAVHEKLDRFDSRIDEVEIMQAVQNEKLAAIHQVTLANNEALGERLNRQSVTTEGVRQIVDARIESFQLSLKTIQRLIEQVLDKDCKVD